MEKVAAIVTYQTRLDMLREKLRRRYFKKKKDAVNFVKKLAEKGNVIVHVSFPSEMVSLAPEVFKEEEVIHGRFYEIY